MKITLKAMFFILAVAFAGLACGSEPAGPDPAATPTQGATVQATTETQAKTSTPYSPEPTQEPTGAPPTDQPASPPSSAPSPEATPEPTDAPEDTPGPEDTAIPDPTSLPESSPAGSGAGPVSFLVGEGSKITFTVEEELNLAPVRFDAVVSGTGLTGIANLDGSPSEITLDLHSLESDQRFRDRYIRSRLFPDTPTATVIVENLPDLPQSFFDGEEASGTLEGSLQIGETVIPLTFDVTARHDGSVINVLGSTTFTWDQLGLPTPTAGPVVYLADEVRVQVLIVAHAR